MSDCTETPPDFWCEHADPGQQRCPEWRCDCFIDTYPDSPFDLHPEAFLVDGHARHVGGQHTVDCPGCHPTKEA